uniref:NADH-ubiquinone oxidoreductase chain 3 n=1 Tax=Doru luteipes TaxID=1514967 RepID=A0A2U8XDS6_9NEOP|nr:NADH dehydrogenase subunit 3 [Doru luteipes]
MASAMIGVALVMGKKSPMDREKNSPFECGFDPWGSTRLPFSLRFFLIAVVFLVFDVEIVLLFPLVPSPSFGGTLSWGWSGATFLGTLLAGLGFEWDQGALEWAR